MNIYNVEFIVNDDKGIATIQAASTGAIQEIMQTYGKFNCYRYNITKILHLGNNDATVAGLLKEDIIVEKFLI